MSCGVYASNANAPAVGPWCAVGCMPAMLMPLQWDHGGVYASNANAPAVGPWCAVGCISTVALEGMLFLLAQSGFVVMHSLDLQACNVHCVVLQLCKHVVQIFSCDLQPNILQNRVSGMFLTLQ